MKTGLVTLLFLWGCDQVSVRSAPYDEPATQGLKVDAFRNVGAIRAPAGFTRLPCKEGSFGHWLRTVALKPDNRVYLYDGRLKSNQQVQYAVIDVSVGNRDLQQCADAIMRLRAEFLFEQKRFSDIVFIDNLSKRYTWTGGSNKTSFQKYLDRVFGMCGTASLEKQLNPASMKNIEPGDVLIKGGFPGHAMIVVDVAVNAKGERRFMLAQSYMPAQDIHIVKNPNANNSPWYKADELQPVTTPEWTFVPSQLRKW
ncbi:DUF4846 domain-containing protein [Niabella yanshanensis]|uniref:DUF4846 domain-containing protein n=1 Tax=Niabella yanshanensis TaxID=577386 RepID=A0ABZ0W212_9BACT|nr:DUF4846 domain-containing protein [Niabella yanshanensis]WQD37236.1 DUF4846 domain-containing protein [Niabella yanshanensis]